MDFHDGGKHGCLKICNKTENPAGFLSKWTSTKYLAKVNTKELNNLPQSACVDVAEYSVGKKKKNSWRSHKFWKMFIWGLRCSSKPMIMGCLSLCQYKDNITQPRRTYQPRWPHLRCWRSERWDSLWRSQPGPPPCERHTYTHLEALQKASSESISLGG